MDRVIYIKKEGRRDVIRHHTSGVWIGYNYVISSSKWKERKKQNQPTSQPLMQTRYLRGVEYRPISSFGCIESLVRSVLSTAANEKTIRAISPQMAYSQNLSVSSCCSTRLGFRSNNMPDNMKASTFCLFKTRASRPSCVDKQKRTGESARGFGP